MVIDFTLVDFQAMFKFIDIEEAPVFGNELELLRLSGFDFRALRMASLTLPRKSAGQKPSCRWQTHCGDAVWRMCGNAQDMKY